MSAALDAFLQAHEQCAFIYKHVQSISGFRLNGCGMAGPGNRFLYIELRGKTRQHYLVVSVDEVNALAAYDPITLLVQRVREYAATEQGADVMAFVPDRAPELTSGTEIGTS